MLLKKFDAVICHNDHMRHYLLEQGFDSDKLFNLEIFDYLSDVSRVQPEKGRGPSIAIAGNLATGKSSYIYDIFAREKNKGLKVHLYGVMFDASRAHKNMLYHGSFKPEELPEKLEGDFGLVWDGNSAETCAGNTGEYLKYNNPHKTSLYLSSGMPVIVWSKSAIADFVLGNGVGISVDSLLELEEKISGMSNSEYSHMCEQVTIVAERLKAGYYFKTALENAISILMG